MSWTIQLLLRIAMKIQPACTTRDESVTRNLYRAESTFDLPALVAPSRRSIALQCKVRPEFFTAQMVVNGER
jgi:hypothetical protein